MGVTKKTNKRKWRLMTFYEGILNTEMEFTSTPPGENNVMGTTKRPTACVLFSSGTLELLTGITIPKTVEEAVQAPNVTREIQRPISPVLHHFVPERKSCAFCEMEFKTRLEQKHHFKSDWHLFNLKRKMKLLDMVTEDKFEELASGISSISGSDLSDSGEDESPDVFRARSPLPKQLEKIRRRRTSSTESDSDSSITRNDNAILGRKHPKVFFRALQGELISMHRCILHGKRNQPDSDAELVAMATDCPSNAKWAILMTGGGHFAGGIFERETLLVHKTFHRYTVRAKRGSAQGAHDSQGNAPKSGGASLRRYNEAALTQEIQDLLESWTDHLNTCTAIFVRTPTYNRGIFFSGKKSPIKKGDQRIRSLPFPTRRATFSEVKRIHGVLATVENYGTGIDIGDIITPSPKRNRGRRPNLNENGSPERPKSRSRGSSPVLSKQGPLNGSSGQSSSGAGSDVDLESVEVSLSTLDLKEFDGTKPPRRRKRAKHKKKMTAEQSDVSSTSSGLDNRTKDLKNRLYTACKTGDITSLHNIMASFEADGVADNSGMIGSYLHEGNQKRTNKLDEQNNSHSGNSDEAFADDDIRYQRECSQSFSDSNDTKANNGQMNLMPQQDSIPEFHDKMADNVIREVKDIGDMPSGIDKGMFLNEVMNNNGDLLLHIVASSGQSQMVFPLMQYGADPCQRNRMGQTPYVLSKDRITRNEFRRFRSEFCDRFDYDKAQIPPPLSEEAENAKKQKEADRRKAQKKAKREKLKVQKEVEAAQREEERMKQRFLQLSDREKRALAAERRLTEQAQSRGDSVPVLSRCYECGADITGKVPFEYFDFKFCTTTCLRQHKAKHMGKS